MKYLLLLLLLIISSIPNGALAQAPVTPIGVYSDSFGGDCFNYDTPGTHTLYVVQKFSLGATAVRFRIENSPGFTATLLSAAALSGTVVGDPLTGVTVTFGACLTGTVPVMRLDYMFDGNSQECSYVRTAAHPLSPDGTLEYYDCIGTRQKADWYGTHIQKSPPLFTICPDLAGIGHTGYGCKPVEEPIAVDASTWGAVKALYR